MASADGLMTIEPSSEILQFGSQDMIEMMNDKEEEYNFYPESYERMSNDF